MSRAGAIAIAAIRAVAVRAVAHPGERGVDFGEVRQHVADFREIELGQAVGDAPFVAAFLDPVAQPDDAVVAAAGELRLHFDAQRGAAGLELGLQARALVGRQCVLGHGAGFRGDDATFGNGFIIPFSRRGGTEPRED